MSNENNKTKFSKSKLKDLTLVALFTAVIAVCSFITIPGSVPFTMQTFGVFCALAILGGKKGTISVLLYIALGAIGLPVFAGFTGGIGHILGATGGYIVGFLATAIFYWILTHFAGEKLWVKLVGLVVGLVICYLFGTIWFVAVHVKVFNAAAFGSALMTCVVPFIIPDLLKLGLALLVDNRVSRLIKKA